MIDRQTNAPTVSHILFLAILRVNCVCMMAQLVVEHFSENEFTERTNPTERARRHFDLVYKDLYPSLLSSPFVMVESRHVFPLYAPSPSG